MIGNSYFYITSFNTLNSIFILDIISSILIILTIWVSSLIIIARTKTFNEKKNGKLLLITIYILLIILIIAFRMNNIFLFYIIFEASLIPTVIIIIGWGYQPERLRARVYLLLYTVTASLPLLCILSSIHSNIHSLFLINMSSTNIRIINITTSLILSLAFIIKLPIYITHLWLPKAHVEAPVAGSIILAGVLLKLGAYGLIRIIHIQNKIFSSISRVIISISLWGAIITSLICLRQHDIKSLIAYSSIGHIALVLMRIIYSLSWGWEGAIMIIIAHGLARSGLFTAANSYYESINTRRIFLTKGLWNIFPTITLWWFLLLLANIGAPPTLNLIREILILTRIITTSLPSSLIIIVILFLTVAYSLTLFTSLHHGTPLSYTSPLSGNMTKNRLLIIPHTLPTFILILCTSIISFT